MGFNLTYSRHAYDRMAQRGVSKTNVEYCLANRDTDYPDGYGNQVIKATLPDGRRAKVIARIDSDGSYFIITVAADLLA